MGVVGVRQGVNAFGNVQGSAPTGDGFENISATDKAKLGSEDIGAMLNRVADPNWTDPTKKTRVAGNPNLDKDAFFKLMLAQMKNQDPTSPLKSHEMAAQLASFSSLEQMQNVNTTLTEIKNGQKPSENFQVLNLIGKAVAGDSSVVMREKGDKDHDIEFNLPMDKVDTMVKIRNAEGEIVRTYDLKALKQGANKITWNGQNDKGQVLPAGEYQAVIEGKTGDGTKVGVKTAFEGTITGVNYTKEGPVLLVGTQTIRMRDVKKITDPRLMKNDQKIANATALDLKTDSGLKETEGAPAAPAQAGINKIMENVGLSREMMTKLAKETKL